MKALTLEVSSSKAGYAAVSNSVVRASRKLQMASSATSRARNSNGNSTLMNESVNQDAKEEQKRIHF